MYASMDIPPFFFSIIGIVLLITTGIMLTLAIFYYRSILRVLNGIRNGLMGGPVFQLPSIKVFTVFACIFIGFSVLSSLINMITYPILLGGSITDMYSALYSLPHEIRRFIEPLIANIELRIILTSISALVTSAGSILCIIVLNRFNNRLKASQSLTDY